jgi:hypothetical protein
MPIYEQGRYVLKIHDATGGPQASGFSGDFVSLPSTLIARWMPRAYLPDIAMKNKKLIDFIFRP